MKAFEVYRPIMVKDFTLDWLNNFTVKEVNLLRANREVANDAGREVDFDLTATVSFIQQAMKEVMNNRALIYGVSRRTTKDFIGEFSLLNYDPDEKSMELHYELLPEFQGQGIMTDILEHMITFAFEELGLTYLYAVAKTTNQIATHQLEKLGFKTTLKMVDSIHYRLYASENNPTN